jgi:hypothetical protein
MLRRGVTTYDRNFDVNTGRTTLERNAKVTLGGLHVKHAVQLGN